MTVHMVRTAMWWMVVGAVVCMAAAGVASTDPDIPKWVVVGFWLEAAMSLVLGDWFRQCADRIEEHEGREKNQ